MAGDFVGCALIRKKSTSGSANSSGGTNSDGQRSSSSSSSTKRNNESGESRSRRIFDNNNGNGGGSGGGRSNPGVLVPVAHYKDPLKTYKIVILGDGGVGKSAVTLQFVSHSFLEYHDPTIEDAYQQQAVIDGQPAMLDILDTAGQVEFTAMRDQYMRCGEGFIICYSVTDRRSFQEASEYRKLIGRVRLTQDIPLVLIANKLDLQQQRTVSTEEGKLLASEFGCPFYETSACLRHYIDDVFYTLVREIRKKENKRDSDSLSQSPSSISIDKMHKKRSRWWRIRSILALVFRRKRHLN